MPTTTATPSYRRETDTVLALTTFGLIALVWLLPQFPSQDGPAHLWTGRLAGALARGSEVLPGLALAPWYRPNWGVALVSLLVPGAMVAEKVVLTIAIGGYVLAFRLWLRRWCPENLWISLAAVPLVLSRSLAFGFYNFLLGAVVMLFALATSPSPGEAGSARRWGAVGLLGLASYLCHPLPFGVGGVALLLIHLFGPGWKGALASVVPTAAVAAFWFRREEGLGGIPLALPDASRWTELAGSSFLWMFDPQSRLLAWFGSLAFLAVAAACVRSPGRQGWLGWRGRTALALLAVALFVPEKIGLASYLGQRIAWLAMPIALALLPGTRRPRVAGLAALILCGVAVGIAGFNGYSIWTEARRVGAVASPALLEPVRPGATLAVLAHPRSRRLKWRADPLTHVEELFHHRCGSYGGESYQLRTGLFAVELRDDSGWPPPVRRTIRAGIQRKKLAAYDWVVTVGDADNLGRTILERIGFSPAAESGPAILWGRTP